MFINTPTVIFVTVFVWGNIFDQHLEINILPRNLFGGIVRFIFGLLLCGIILTANARVLHVGDNTIKLSESKTTTPALHIRVGDELWYANMGKCPLPMNENTDKELKVKYNNTNYWVSDIGDYVIVDGKLIAANCNIYLESTGTQWIDTGFIPKNTSKFVTTVQLVGPINVSIFGTTTTPIQNNRIQLFINLAGDYAFRLAYTDTGFDSTISGHTKADITYDINNNFFSINDWNFVRNFILPEFTKTLALYGQAYGTNSIRTLSESRFYYFKIWDNDVLVRHFVPVPCGLQIGDFVVPSNGMWDIVEQKFYGNMGTGDFIYGMDE